MEADPVELAPGKLGCPECRYPLEPSLVPVFHSGAKLGAFDGIACKMCGYGLLTEKGHDDKGRALESLDGVLPPSLIDNVAEIYVAIGSRVHPVTPGDLNAEKTVSATRAEMPLSPIMTLQKDRRIINRLV